MTGPIPDHALLVRYLLGELPEEERLKIEQDCLANDELFEQLEAIEAELTDDYVRGTLRGRQRREFEQRLLKTAQIDLSKLLISPPADSRWSRPSWMQLSFRPLFTSFAAVSVAILLGWFSLTHWLSKPAAQPALVAQRTPPPLVRRPADLEPSKSSAKRLIRPRPSAPLPLPLLLPGNLHGAIVDPTGAAIENAQVAITNKTTGAIVRSQTDSAGNYTFRLPPGDYSLSAKAQGFLPSELQAKVNPDQTVNQDLALSVQTVSNTVEVTASAPTVMTSEAQQAVSIKNKAITTLPDLQAQSSFFRSVVPSFPQINPPNNAINIFVNTSVVLHFSQLPQTPSVTLSPSTGPIAGSVVTSSDRRYLTFRPSLGLAANTRYSVNVNGSVQSSFTTGASSDNGAPTVQKLSTSPRVILQFSKPMDPTSFGGVAGSMQFSPDLRTVTFAGRQAITLTTAVKDIYGNSLANQVTF